MIPWAVRSWSRLRCSISICLMMSVSAGQSSCHVRIKLPGLGRRQTGPLLSEVPRSHGSVASVFATYDALRELAPADLQTSVAPLPLAVLKAALAAAPLIVPPVGG